MATIPVTKQPGSDLSATSDAGLVELAPNILNWSAIVAGALVAAAVSFVLVSFGSAIGFAVVSPSSTWRDTSSILAVLGGLWLLLIALVSFGLGGYIAGRLRQPWSDTSVDAVEFRDGIHGVLVWGIAIIIGALLATAALKPVSGRTDLTTPSVTNAEPLLAFELDRMFRSDRTPVDPANDPEMRALAARILTTSLGHTGIAQDDRSFLVRLVETRTGLPQQEAEERVNQAIAQAHDAISRARRGVVILGFMIAASLMLGLAAAWLAATFGGQHRDKGVHHDFWRRWEVDRLFIVR